MAAGENDYFKSQPIPPRLILKMLPWMFDKLPSTVREQRLAEAPLLYRVVYRLFRGSLPTPRATDLPLRRLKR